MQNRETIKESSVVNTHANYTKVWGLNIVHFVCVFFRLNVVGVCVLLFISIFNFRFFVVFFVVFFKSRKADR